jgi:trimethylamine:corrinoid methyltransferase-like protein
MTYAKKVFSFDSCRTIDRTKQPHDLGKFDVDFYAPHAENKDARKWTYGGSARTIEKARIAGRRILNQTAAEVARIVNAETGEVLDRIKRSAHTPP